MWGKKNPHATIVPPSRDALATTCASVPVIDTPRPTGKSRTEHSEAATTPDDALLVSRPDSDASRDVSLSRSGIKAE